MSADEAAFAASMALVFGGLGLYALHLARLRRRLARAPGRGR